MDTTYIKKQLKRYRRLRRRDQMVARVKNYFVGFAKDGVAVRLILGGIAVAGIMLAFNFLISFLGSK